MELAKFFYSLLLFFVIAFSGRELINIWFDKTVYLGKFNYSANGVNDDAAGQALATNFARNQSLFVDLLNRQARTRSGPETRMPTERSFLRNLLPSDTSFLRRYLPFKKPETPQKDGFFWRETDIHELESWKSDLPEVQFSYQGLDVGGILSALRKLITAPNEIKATIHRNKDANNDFVSATLFWSKAPAIQAEAQKYGSILSEAGKHDDNDLAFRLACRHLWLSVHADLPAVRKVSPENFCEWANLWLQFKQLTYGYGSRTTPLSDEETKTLREILKRVTVQIDKAIESSEPYRLRAEIIEILPDRSDEELKTAERDKFIVKAMGEGNSRTQALELASTVLDAEQDAVQTASDTVVDSKAGDNVRVTLQPGLGLFVDGSASVTAGPIVVDKDDKRYVVVPDYAVTTNSSSKRPEDAIWHLAKGQKIGTFSRLLNFNMPDVDAEVVAPPPGVALIELSQDVAAANQLSNGMKLVKLRPPKVGEEVVVTANAGFEKFNKTGVDVLRRTTVERIGIDSGPLFLLTDRLGSPGSGGTPIVSEEDGSVLGIIYLSMSAKSLPLDLTQLLEENGLALDTE